jgi:antitoxin CptB
MHKKPISKNPFSSNFSSKNAATKNAYMGNKVYWASRRGMLELDLVLMPFAEKVYPTLKEEDQGRYHQLLEQEDQDLFTWFLGRGQPEDPEIRMIVEIVLANTGMRDA